MTKKDYEKFATALRDARQGYADINTGVVKPSPEVDAVTVCAHRIARVLAEDNPRFDVERFLEACGVPCEEWNL